MSSSLLNKYFEVMFSLTSNVGPSNQTVKKSAKQIPLYLIIQETSFQKFELVKFIIHTSIAALHFIPVFFLYICKKPFPHHLV